LQLLFPRRNAAIRRARATRLHVKGGSFLATGTPASRDEKRTQFRVHATDEPARGLAAQLGERRSTTTVKLNGGQDTSSLAVASAVDPLVVPIGSSESDRS
jgi:hypothetical protein